MWLQATTFTNDTHEQTLYSSYSLASRKNTSCALQSYFMFYFLTGWGGGRYLLQFCITTRSYPNQLIYTATDTAIWLRLTVNYTYRDRREIGEEITSFLHQKAFKIVVPPKKQALRNYENYCSRKKENHFNHLQNYYCPARRHLLLIKGLNK